MSEKQRKINKFVNYQNIIVRNSPAFDCHVFVFSQDRWSMVFDVMRMISTQIRWQDHNLVARGPFRSPSLTKRIAASGNEIGKTIADRFASCENIVWISFKRMYGK